MKKRILALALVGTTAFSVFGAAMSANAASWWTQYGSSHIDAYDGDYYNSLVAPGDLTWNVNHGGQDYVDVTDNFYYMGSESAYRNLKVNDEGERIVDADDFVMAPWDNGSTDYEGLRDDVVHYDGTLGDSTTKVSGYRYFETTDALMDDLGYNAEVAGNYGVVGNNEYVIAKNTQNGTYYIFAYDVWDKYLGDGEDNTSGVNQSTLFDNAQTVQGTYYLADGAHIPTMAEVSANTSDEGYGVRIYTDDELRDTAERKYGYFMAKNGATYNSQKLVYTNLYFVPSSANSSTVYTGNATTDGRFWKENGSAVTGSNFNGVEADIDAVMSTPVIPGVVYEYDYDLPNSVDYEDLADAVQDGNAAEYLADATGGDEGTLEPEVGYPGHGLREDVIMAWEDFLDEIGVSDHSNKGLTLWAKNILSNYSYTYTDDVYVWNVVGYDKDGNVVAADSDKAVYWEIECSTGESVDLYNFEDLIADIMELAPADEAENAQTSELVYLMQQYTKFVDGEFVTEKPVDTDDWGDLLVSLAQAPTEDEFRTATRYRAYTNKVEDLVEQYEEAETSAAVLMAESALYDFVTSYYSSYAVDTRADTTVLATSIGNTYVNYDWSNAPAYNGAIDTDGRFFPGKGYTETSSWGLYPLEDYDGVTGEYFGENPGVAGRVTSIAGKGVSAEYGWFYNVYTLAYDVYKGNRYQSVIDLMATTLDEAVEALEPTRVASPSEVLGAEEAYDEIANLVDTDYEAGMWANWTKITTFITERVSNDETGSIAADNAEEIANWVDTYLGYQKNQTSVTRGEINNVKTAMGNAQTALEELRNDEENYNAAQANALEKAISNCEYLIDLYNGDYSRTDKKVQSINGDYNGKVGDKDQLLKSMISDALEEVDAAINFKNIIQGWSQDEDKNWMYGTEEGYLNDGWHQVDGGKTWFYFNEDGTAKQSDWWQDPATGTWYWFNSNCGAAVGWAKIDGDWYYFKGNNAMKTGWEKVEGSWYYMNSSGKMVTGWCQINGTWYYFSKESNALGQMLANTTTPDGYKVDANGALVE